MKLLIIKFIVIVMLPTTALANSQCYELFNSSEASSSRLKNRLKSLKMFSWVKTPTKKIKSSVPSSAKIKINHLFKLSDPIRLDRFEEEAFAKVAWELNSEKFESVLKNESYSANEKVQEVMGDYLAFRYENLKPKKAAQIQMEIEQIMSGNKNINPGLNLFLKNLSRFVRVKTQLGFEGKESTVMTESIGQILKVFHANQALSSKQVNKDFMLYTSQRLLNSLVVLFDAGFGTSAMIKIKLARSIKETVDFTKQLPKETIETIKSELQAKEVSKELDASEQKMLTFLLQVLKDASSDRPISFENYNGLFVQKNTGILAIRFALLNSFIVNLGLAYSNPSFDPTIIGIDLSAIYWLLTLL